jgi:hypothetical protein
MDRHPTTRGWLFPPDERPAPPPGSRRVNLRELAARPARFEHHLMVVAEVGGAQLELATASEPLYFAHINHSDEYALALPTGDPRIDTFGMRTFLSDAASGLDSARIRHRPGQLVLHPLGWLHWTGRLRPPFTPFSFPPDARRCGLSLVFCAVQPADVAEERPLCVTAGLEEEVKPYLHPAPPLGLWDLAHEEPGPVAASADARIELGTTETVTLPHGGYVVVLEASEGSAFFATDLVYLPPRPEPWTLAGVTRHLRVVSPANDAAPPPPSWDAAPEAPWRRYEQAAAGELPVAIGELLFEAIDDHLVRVSVAGGEAEVPRYWLARMTYRLALHAYRVGYLETYGGFFYDDRDGHRIGLRGVGSISLEPTLMADQLERLYRAVAPPGYVEDLV